MKTTERELRAVDAKTGKVVADGIMSEHDDWLQDKGFDIEDQLKAVNNSAEKRIPLDEYELGDVMHELGVCAIDYYKEPEFEDFSNFLQSCVDYCKENCATVTFAWETESRD
jgi:hypothetical protein